MSYFFTPQQIDKEKFKEKKLKELNSKEIMYEIQECSKEIKVYSDMQQVFTFDYIDYVRWTE